MLLYAYIIILKLCVLLLLLSFFLVFFSVSLLICICHPLASCMYPRSFNLPHHQRDLCLPRLKNILSNINNSVQYCTCCEERLFRPPKIITCYEVRLPVLTRCRFLQTTPWFLNCSTMNPASAMNPHSSILHTPAFAHCGVAWSPFHTPRFAVATSANYGLVGNGRLNLASVLVPPGPLVHPPPVNLDKTWV